MRTIPCLLSNDGSSTEQIPEKIANYNFMLQVLTGDKVDGYDGIEGVKNYTQKYMNLNQSVEN